MSRQLLANLLLGRLTVGVMFAAERTITCNGCNGATEAWRTVVARNVWAHKETFSLIPLGRYYMCIDYYGRTYLHHANDTNNDLIKITDFLLHPYAIKTITLMGDNLINYIYFAMCKYGQNNWLSRER